MLPSTFRAEVTLKLDRLPFAKITPEGEAVLVMPATLDGLFRYRIRLSPNAWRKASKAVAEAQNPYFLLIKGKLLVSGGELVVQNAGIQCVLMKKPKTDKTESPSLPAPVEQA